MEHVHRYKVINRQSVFGLHNIHAVMECIGVVDKKPCRHRIVELHPYEDFEKHGTVICKYFYPKQ